MSNLKPLPFRQFIPLLLQAWRDWKTEPEDVTRLDMLRISFWYSYFYLKGVITREYPEP